MIWKQYKWSIEGISSLVFRIFSHYFKYIFHYQQYYLLQHTIFEGKESEFIPNIDGYEVKIIQSNEDAEKLYALGYNFCSFWLLANRRLERGGIAVCIFIEKNLVNIGWIALTRESKCIIDRLPYDIDFDSEACFAGSRTDPKYRGKGLMKFNEYRKYRVLFDKGIMTARSHIQIDNIRSQKAQIKFAPKVYAKARYLVIFPWKSWKESPLTPPLTLAELIS